MDRRNPFYRQAALVVRVLPLVARRDEFALKGGTAINLFLRDLPRLSIDIDLTYLPRTPREEALPAIRQGLDAVATDLKATIPRIGVQATDPSATDALRLTLALDGCRIKIEVSPVGAAARSGLPKRGRLPRRSRKAWATPRTDFCRSTISTRARCARRSTGSTRATCSTSRCCRTTKASAGTCSRPFSST